MTAQESHVQPRRLDHRDRARAERAAFGRLGPSRRRQADEVRRSGVLGREASKITSLSRWYSRWTRLEGRPDVRVRGNRNRPDTLLVDLAPLRDAGRSLSAAGEAEVFRLLARACAAGGRIVRSPVGLTATSISPERSHAVAVACAAIIQADQAEAASA